MQRWKVHWILLRPFATAGLIPPMLLGFALADQMTWEALGLLMWAFVGAMFILYGTHYHNSYSDFVKGLDVLDPDLTPKKYTSGSQILPKGLASVREVVAGCILLYGLGLLTWIILAVHVGSIIVLIPGLIGLGCGISYNIWGKYKGYGELHLALSFGLGSTLGGYLPINPVLSWDPFLASVIPAALWSLFYTIDQYQDREEDAMWGLKNLAMKLDEYPFPISRFLQMGYTFTMFYHLILVNIGLFSPLTFISILTIPLMFMSIAEADNNPKKAGVLTILTFGFYVILMDFAMLVS